MEDKPVDGSRLVVFFLGVFVLLIMVCKRVFIVKGFCLYPRVYEGVFILITRVRSAEINVLFRRVFFANLNRPVAKMPVRHGNPAS